ncbi:murein transglycosylase A [Pasteurellaceae bacterium LFhippo2]|nr:murein transglycosylase A [Pasteurellaceae bacterium LFhippo2]
MSWKAYSKFAAAAGVALILAGCSSTPSNQKVYTSDTTKFGAVFNGRQPMPAYMQMAPVKNVGINAQVVNPRDFMQQVANVRAYSTSLTNNNAHTYGKLSNWLAQGGKIEDLAKYGINANLMRGEDGYQNVLMTGYYIPVIKARMTRQGEFQHPIYAIPQGNRKYSRAEIYNGALAGRGLELAYSNSMLDNFLMEVQGSGFVDIGGGNLRHFAYGNKNGYSYTSVGRLLVEDGEIPKEKMSIQAIREWGEKNPHRLQGLLERNQSFVYFRHDHTLDVKGSAGVPLVALASVASDTNIVPSGSVLLVEMPLIDNNGNYTGKREMRLMVALDRGGAVKGQHFDLYQGIGDKAGHTAGLMKHYGRVWVLR